MQREERGPGSPAGRAPATSSISCTGTGVYTVEVVIALGLELLRARTVVSTWAKTPRTVSVVAAMRAHPSSGAGIVSLTSTIDSDGISLMKPRNRMKNQAKLPTMIVDVRAAVGT